MLDGDQSDQIDIEIIKGISLYFVQRSCLFGSDQEETKTEDLLKKYKAKYHFECEIIEDIIQHEMKLRYQSFRIDKIEESIFLT